MKKLRIWAFCAALAACVLVLAWVRPVPRPLPGPAAAGTPLRIMVATDLHYISPRVTDFGALFMRTVVNGDGKLSERSGEIVDGLIRTALKERPDALVLSGDLTFNGERKSLEDLTEKLRAVQEAGIPVLVLPGNHDVGYLFAYRYAGETAYYAQNITQSAFAELCAEFGYESALSRDEGSFSYVYELAEDFRLLFLDANTAVDRGKLSQETLAWAKEQLEAARAAGAAVISVSHQNVLRQSERLYKGYVIGNSRETAQLLREYGVSVHLSGHSHIQHSASVDGLTDYCTGCLSLAPLRYAMVEIDEERQIRYRPQSLGILQREAEERFTANVRRQLAEELAALGLLREQQEAMIVFAAQLNLNYFAGTVDAERFLADPAWTLWESLGEDSFWLEYMRSMLGA